MANPTTTPRLRFLCFGVGAIGTYIGGSLAVSGQDVVFLDRPDTAEEVRNKGIHLQRKDGKFSVEQPVVMTGIEEALQKGPFDAAILAVKSFDTNTLLNELTPFYSQLPPLICFQNGVENETLIAAALGEDKAIAGTVTTAIGRMGPGSIRVERLRGVGISANHSFSVSLGTAFDQAGLNARLYKNDAAMKWSKMLTNLLANASSAILDMPPCRSPPKKVCAVGTESQGTILVGSLAFSPFAKRSGNI